MPTSASAWQNMNKTTQTKPRVQTSAGNFSQRGAPSGPFTPAFLQAMARSPIPTMPQAHYSMYASRIRTGATLLVQPILNAAAPPIIDDGVPPPRPTAHAPSANIGRSTRRGGHKNYVETGSGDELEEEKHGPEGSDDSDFQASGGTRTMIRKMGKGTTASSSAPGKVPHPPEPKPQVEIDKSYLGTMPPPNLIYSRPAHHVRLEPQLVYSFLYPSLIKPFSLGVSFRRSSMPKPNNQLCLYQFGSSWRQTTPAYETALPGICTVCAFLNSLVGD